MKAQSSSKTWTGIWTALVTPFKPQKKGLVVDWTAYRQLLKRQVDAGVAGVVPCGTTGETPTLNEAEKKQLIKIALQVTKKTPLRVIAGTGSNNTAESIRFSKWAAQAGVHGLLVVCPYYNKPTQRGLYQHFTAIADATKCPVMLYNVPSRTSISLTASTIAQLSLQKRITSLKEATGDMNFLDEIRQRLQDNQSQLQLFSGDDVTFVDFMRHGGHGMVSVASNLIPEVMNSIYHAASQGNWLKAEELQKKYLGLFKALFVEPNPVPVKFALSKLGWCHPDVRLPLVELEEKNQQLIQQVMQAVQLLPESSTRKTRAR